MNIKGTLIFETINRGLIEIAFLRNAARNIPIFLQRSNSAGVYFKQNTIENILND